MVRSGRHIRPGQAPLLAHTYDNIYSVDRVFRHWWNGRYGRIGRRDVFVWTDDDHRQWAVEARRGGAEGPSRRQGVASEREALELAQRWRALGGDDWRDLSRIYRERPPARDEPG